MRRRGRTTALGQAASGSRSPPRVPLGGMPASVSDLLENRDLAPKGQGERAGRQPPSVFDCMTIKWYLPYSLWPKVNSTSISKR